jgi:hypothetical protein
MALGLELAELRAELDVDALAGRTVKLRVDHGVLRLGGAILTNRPIPGQPIMIAGLRNGLLVLDVTTEVIGRSVRAEVELRLSVSGGGRLRVEPENVRASGVSLPKFVVGIALGVLRRKLEGKPGVHFAAGNVIEADFQEIARRGNVELAPLRRVRTTDASLELEFGT